MLRRVDALSAARVAFGADGRPLLGVPEADGLPRRLADVLRGLEAPEGAWVLNHRRWIVWKLAALERRYPDGRAGVLSEGAVLLQLMKRYHAERGGCLRSPLRRIAAGDASPRRPLCLLLAGTRAAWFPGDPGAAGDVVLSDGWYPVLATLDGLLLRQYRAGRLREGCKIALAEAQLALPDGPAEPLDYLSAPPSRWPALRLAGNACRKARWDLRLGFLRAPALRVPLGSLRADGGVASEVVASVDFVRPLEYLDRAAGGAVLSEAERRRAELAALEALGERLHRESSSQDPAAARAAAEEALREKRAELRERFAPMRVLFLRGVAARGRAAGAHALRTAELTVWGAAAEDEGSAPRVGAVVAVRGVRATGGGGGAVRLSSVRRAFAMRAVAGSAAEWGAAPEGERRMDKCPICDRDMAEQSREAAEAHVKMCMAMCAADVMSPPS